MKLVKLLLVLVVLAGPVLLGAQHAEAQGQTEIELENVVALVSFGEGITFVATVKNPLPVREASILILDETRGVTRVEPLTVQADGRTEFRYETRQHDLRPFGKLSWSYQFTLPDGSITNSEVYSTHYDDNRFDWQTVEAGMFNIHWYGSDADFGQSLLKTAQAGLESVKRLIPAELDRPVEFYVYASLADLRGTLVPGSQDWIAGHADPSLGVVMVAIEPGSAQESIMQQRIPHELMHVMLSRAMGDEYSKIPAWLREGTASLAELTPNTSYDGALKNAVSRSDWIPLNALCTTFPAETDRAFLAYAEARSFTSYIYETYGSSGLFNLVTAYANGASCEDGPDAALGVPLARLERDWLASVAGQKALPASLQNIAPYLVLLCLVLLVPLIGIAAGMRKKGSHHDPKPKFGK